MTSIIPKNQNYDCFYLDPKGFTYQSLKTVKNKVEHFLKRKNIGYIEEDLSFYSDLAHYSVYIESRKGQRFKNIMNALSEIYGVKKCQPFS